MLQIKKLSKSFGHSPLFQDVSFSMTRNEKVGLVGRNGHGKSTLFKLIIGSEEADEGEIIIPKDYHVGHLEQLLHFTKPSVLEEACLGLKNQYDTYKAKIVLTGLGFSEDSMTNDPKLFSGGFQLRINLAKLLLSEPNLLLLDEPTNYLDIVSVRWLTKELKSFRGELIIISHDRDFMDSVTTHTMGIHRNKLRKVEGNTEKYYTLLAQDEEVYEKTRVNEEKKRKEVEEFINRFRAKASKANLVQSRIKQLERTQTGEKLAEIRNLDFSFQEKQFLGRYLLEAVEISYEYIQNLPLFKDLTFNIKNGERIGIIGKNGKGKSTLLKVLAGEYTPTAGNVKKNEKTSTGYFGQTNILNLSPELTIEEEIRSANTNLSRTQVRTVCGIIMFDGDKAEKRISVLSGGEKSRVLLGKILATPTNLLLLDEPTSHLDMESIDALIESIHEFSGGVIIVTHSELILNALCTKLIIFREDEVLFFNGTYEEFLKKYGWEDEREERPTSSGVLRIEKGSSIGEEEKKRFLKDIRKELRDLEKEYASITKKRETIHQRITEYSAKEEYQTLKPLTVEDSELQAREEQLFERIMNLMEDEEKYSAS
jgi:ATP-binding cassette, subfamily F, member 3